MYGAAQKFEQSSAHRCGQGGSMRACHAAGPSSIPGRDKFPGFFRGFSSPVRQMSGIFRSPRSTNIIWPSSSIIIYYGHQWPEMLTSPKTWNIHTKQTLGRPRRKKREDNIKMNWREVGYYVRTRWILLIIRNFKSRLLSSAGQITRKEQSWNPNRVLVGRPEGETFREAQTKIMGGRY